MLKCDHAWMIRRMARIREVPGLIHSVGVFTFLKRVVQQTLDDDVLTWAAALAYSWLFAVFPFLIFLLSIVPLLPDRFRDQAADTMVSGVEQSLVGDSAALVAGEVRRILEQPSPGLLSVGLLFAIWAASGGMSATMRGLDAAYDIVKPRPFWKQRLYAIVLTLIGAVLIIATLVLLPIGTAIVNWLDARGALFGWSKFFLDLARYFLGVTILFALLALIYHFGPSIKRRFHLITPGAIVCVLVWILVGWGFNVYLTSFGGQSSYSRTYGAVGGIAILLLIFYIDAIVLLVGAEINSELDFIKLGLKPEEKHIPVESLTDEEDRELAEELNVRRDAKAPKEAEPSAQI